MFTPFQGLLKELNLKKEPSWIILYLHLVTLLLIWLVIRRFLTMYLQYGTGKRVFLYAANQNLTPFIPT
ncbi:hypothetical protein GDO86_005517 [Hymenochirus boettgeri]|uniref:Uncharacterized protein n=1 Tax=Hymenochirus boettgeri TaxID=247094 RepID=A0A8T2J9L6_9PIPI|nr:hypothetical protein GDO86_005517 [Hymenochirus boettgeri]